MKQKKWKKNVTNVIVTVNFCHKLSDFYEPEQK